MNSPCRSIIVAVACSCALLSRAQNTVFNPALAGDALNAATYPAVTSTTTGWDILSNKPAPAPTESGGVLTLNMVATGSGFLEAQALFAAVPVQLLPGTYLELTTTFVPTNVLIVSSDNLLFGFYNSGGSAPLGGLLNSGLSSSLATFASGGAKAWIGYNAKLPFSGSPAMLTRPAQTGANNTVQDLVIDGQSSGAGYSTPAGANASSIGALAAALVNGSTYTLDYKLSLSADGLTLTAAVSLYNGTGTTGAGANSLIVSNTGKFSGATLLTKSFDALAIGWRADANLVGNLKISALSVKTTGGTPWFTTQPPPSVLVSIGSDLNLAAVVGGTVSNYQWQVSTTGGSTFTNLDSIANPSAATPALTLTNVQNADAGIYRLVATNAAGSTASTNCTVAVSATPVAPTISTNPVGATVLGGTPYTFHVTVNGTSPLIYQWETSTDGVTFTPIGGATSATYAIPAVSLSDEGLYRVTVSNVAGSITSAAAQLIVNQPLTITSQPVGAALNLGGSATLSITAVGKPAPAYQWYLNGTLISGATNSTYTITSAAAANAGIYTVVVTNSAGDSVTSAGAPVAVLSPTLATTTLTPSSTPTGIAPDTRLTLTFNQPITVGVMGTIKIFDAANATTPVDTIDLITATALMKTLRTTSTSSTQALPVQNKTVGGLTNFNYYPITVAGNTATIYPRNNVLAYGKTYFVTIDPGVFTDSTGLAYAGVTSTSGWTFATKAVGPGSSSTRLVVAADGSGDFYTVQGALDSIPSGNTTPRTIFIRRGTYFEQVYFTGKHALTFLGEDRAQSVIVYPNNNNFNNVSGSYHRMTLQADHVNNVVFANLTVQNSTPKGGSQAEALILNGTTTAQAIVSNVTLLSYQDTLQINGQAYVTDSHISGDVDFMWGGGPCFFNNCEITELSSGAYFTQIRNGTGNHGYVFSNCRFDAPAGVAGTFLGRIDPSSANFPNSEVVVLDSKIGDATNNAFLNTTTGTSGSNYQAAWWLLNNATSAAAASNVHNWTNALINGSGAALTNPNSDAFTTMPTDATTQANYRNVPWVLGTNLSGATTFSTWTPSLAPLIATAPIAQTINAGGSATLTVQAFGIPTLSYQWLLNGAPIAGATGASYTVASASGADAGTYSVVVSNGSNSLATTAVPVVVHGAAPVIVLQPANTSALLGTTATLNAWAQGDTPFAYQWLKDGSPITGATNQSLRLTGLQSPDAGSYAVAISNAGGTTTSAGATLTIVAPATTVPTLPQIPVATFDITAFGAVGDGATDNTAAIQSAINAAKTAGGGTIELPPASGAYLCGPITLGSHLNLQVDAGATLRALPFGVYPNSRSVPAHFVTIPSGSTDVEFSGGGTIDGDGASWWAAFDAGTIANRPRLIQITKTSNMLFTGVTFLKSPNFHLAFSGANNNTTLFGITISAPGDSPNTDGMDLAGSNFLVQNCSVSDGDDDIVAKPGSVLCRNIYVANCAIGTGHGVSIGGQTNVGLDGMVVTNCTFNGTSSALRFKADPTQGGPVQNVTFSNLTMANVQYPILFYSYYNVLGSPGATSGSSQITPAKVNGYNTTPPNSLASATIPTWQNITITNLTVTNGSGYSTIWGLPTASGLIANVTLNNVNIQGGAGLELYDAANIQFTGSNSVGAIVTDNALAITGQPQSNALSVGGTATFTTTAVGASGITNTPPTYQWNLNGTPLANGTLVDGTTVSGATSTTLTLTNVHVAEAGSITCTVSNLLDGYNVATSSLAPNSLPVSATTSPATLTVQPLPATIALSDLSFTYDGTPKSATATTSPVAGLPVTITYAGSTTPPTDAGSYAVSATIADPNYVGTASDTLTINPAPVSFTFANLNQTYDGTPKTISATASVANAPFAITFNGSATAPTGAGSYDVIATVTNPNYSGTGSTTLTIAKATPTIAWSAPAAITFGTPLGATQLNATASTAGTFVYSPAAGTVLNAGANQSLSVSFSPADVANFTPASAATTITVNKATASVAIDGTTQVYDGTPKTVIVSTTPALLSMSVTYAGASDAPIYPGAYPVVITVNDSNYQASATTTLTISITALVRHAPTIDGGINGSLQVLTAENQTLNGTAYLSGDLLLPGTPTLKINGQPTYAGVRNGSGSATPSSATLTLGGNAVLRYLVRQIDPIAVAVVNPPAAPNGTNDVTVKNGTRDVLDFVTLRNLTVNSATVTLPGGTYGSVAANAGAVLVLGTAGSSDDAIYNLQSLTVSGGATVEVLGPVIINLANGLNVSGTVGDLAHPDWLALRIAAGSATLSGNARVNGSVVAPSSSITLHGNATLTGELIADRLTVDGNAAIDEPTR